MTAVSVRARFVADLDSLVELAGLPVDAPLGVAVSGGPDSMALLLLAAAHAAGPVAAMTVDHGLRAEAADEAAAVAAVCARLGVAHEVARPGRFLCGGNLQAAARAIRYRALGEWAARRGLAAVLVAHHADDQAETTLMRLARGSGLAGLSGIRAVQRFDDDSGGALVLRPLLGWRKDELEQVCAEAGIEPACDPSNADTRFDRTAARAALAGNGWLDATRLAASAAHLAEAEAALATIADQRYAPVSDGDTVTLVPDPLREIARRHVRRLLAERFDARPDGPSIERALAALTVGGRVTCAEVLCRAEDGRWTFRRAPPRRGTDRSSRSGLFHCD